MNEIDKKKVRYYFQEAKKHKDAIKDLYTRTNQYVRPYFVFGDDTKNLVEKNLKYINMDILHSAEDFTNYLMATLLPRGNEWGQAFIEENIMSELLLGVESQYVNATRDKVDKELEQANLTVFRYLNSSNYFNEIYEAIYDAVTLGTGCFKMIETDNIATPLIFEYQSLNNVYILDDAYGTPSYFFKVHKDMNKEKTEQMFTNAKWPFSYSEDLEQRRELIEIIIPAINNKTGERTYTWALYGGEFQDELFSVKMDYSPYVVFRFRQQQGLSFGIGQGLKCLDTYETLIEELDADRAQVQRVANPPLLGTGDIGLYNSISLKAGVLNYGGSSDPNDPRSLRISPILAGQELLPLEQKIQDKLRQIQAAFFVEPLGDLQSGPDMTATEAKLRAEKFRTQFAGVYERIASELLEVTFKNTMIILRKKNYLTLENEKIKVINMKYFNDLSDVVSREKVKNIVEFKQYSELLIGQAATQEIFDPLKMKNFLADNLGVSAEPFKEEEQLQKDMAIAKAQERALLSQRLANASDTASLSGDQVQSIQGGIDNVTK